MKSFLTRPRTRSHELPLRGSGHTHPAAIPVTRSDGALQSLQSAFLHFCLT